MVLSFYTFRHCKPFNTTCWQHIYSIPTVLVHISICYTFQYLRYWCTTFIQYLRYWDSRVQIFGIQYYRIGSTHFGILCGFNTTVLAKHSSFKPIQYLRYWCTFNASTLRVGNSRLHISAFNTTVLAKHSSFNTTVLALHISKHSSSNSCFQHYVLATHFFKLHVCKFMALESHMLLLSALLSALQLVCKFMALESHMLLLSALLSALNSLSQLVCKFMALESHMLLLSAQSIALLHVCKFMALESHILEQLGFIQLIA